MGFTKINMWISIILFVGLISISFMLFGVSIKSNSDIEIDDASKQYVDNYAEYLSETQIDTLAAASNSNYKTESLTGSNETSTSTITDSLSVINFLSTAWNGISGITVFIFNIPSFLLMSLLPKYIAAFSWAINLITYVFFIVIVILFKKFISS